MSIATVEAQIISTVNAVTEVKTVYKYPIKKFAGEFPILTVLYTGFGLTPASGESQDAGWTWEFTVYFPIRNEAESWESLKELVPIILSAFRDNPTLGDTCWSAEITMGKPFWQPDLTNTGAYGHSFQLNARREEV
ncbi:MAG: hypothetical protein WC340_16990 [Kiritimatiellia bacterium]